MKPKRTMYDIVANVLCIGMLVGELIYLLISWSSIPEKIPGHYNATGDVDRWGSKSELLVIPAIAWVLYFGLTALEKKPQIWNTGVQVTGKNKDRVYGILKNLIVTEKTLVVAVFSFMAVNASLSKGLPAWFLPASLTLVFGSLIFFIIKLVKIK